MDMPVIMAVFAPDIFLLALLYDVVWFHKKYHNLMIRL